MHVGLPLSGVGGKQPQSFCPGVEERLSILGWVRLGGVGGAKSLSQSIQNIITLPPTDMACLTVHAHQHWLIALS